MVGAEVSVVRATLMSFIGLLALVIGRGYVARQALLLSLIAITFYDPVHLLHDASLHLSFLATAGIVYMSDGIHAMLIKIQSKSYREIITTTIAAYLATLPYVMYIFGTVSLYALLTNIIVLPLVPLMMFVTFLVVLFAPVSHILALMFGYIDTLLGEVIIFVAHVIERLPFASLTVSVSSTMMCVLYVILVGTFAYNVKRYVRTKRDETLPTKSDEILSEIIHY
jgi:competence protein ComEC